MTRTRRTILPALVTALAMLSGSSVAGATTVWTVSPGAGAVRSTAGTPGGNEVLL